MVEIYQAHPSGTERFIGDYFRTFARLLDPNLPPATYVPEVAASDEPMRWPLGQTMAFASIALVGLSGLLVAIIHYFA